MDTSKASLIRSHVVRALLNKQQVGGNPKFMEDVFADVKPGRTSYCDLIDGLAHLATQLEMTQKEVRNALTSSCFRKDFHDKTNPSNPFPFNDIFREDVDIHNDTEPIAPDDGTLGEQVGVDGLEETDIDQVPFLASSSVGIGGVGLGDIIASPSALGSSMASVDISGVELSDSIASPSAMVCSPFLSPSSRAGRHFTPQGKRSSAYRYRQAGLTSGSKRSNRNCLSPVSAKRLCDPNHFGAYMNSLALMQALMSKANVLLSAGIHKSSFDSGKQKIDSTNPTLLARTLVTDRIGTKKKFKLFASKKGDNFDEMLEMGKNLGMEGVHSSMEVLESYIGSTTEHFKRVIKKVKCLMNDCDSIMDEAERLCNLNIEETAAEKTKRMQEFDNVQADQMESFMASQAAARKHQVAYLDKESKDSTSKIKRMKDSVVGALSLHKNLLSDTVIEQEEEMKNSLVVERSHVKLVKTGLDGLQKALTEGAEAAKGYLTVVLKMQEAIKSDDPNRMKENILDVEIREDDDEEE